MAEGYLGRRGKARPHGAHRGGDDKRNQDSAAESSSAQWDKVKGEGNYKAAREFDEAERRFVESPKLDEAVRNAAPKSDAERREMEAAEERARRRAKEEDPALLRKPGAKSKRSR